MAVSLRETQAGRARTVINNGVKRTSSLLFDYLVQEDKVGLITNMKASCSARGKRRCKSSALWLGSPVASNDKGSGNFACVCTMWSHCRRRSHLFPSILCASAIFLRTFHQIRHRICWRLDSTLSTAEQPVAASAATATRYQAIALPDLELIQQRQRAECTQGWRTCREAPGP